VKEKAEVQEGKEMLLLVQVGLQSEFGLRVFDIDRHKRRSEVRAVYCQSGMSGKRSSEGQMRNVGVTSGCTRTWQSSCLGQTSFASSTAWSLPH